MNPSGPFYCHESDGSIMIKKDQAEIGNWIDNWIDNIEYINEELEYLLDLED